MWFKIALRFHPHPDSFTTNAEIESHWLPKGVRLKTLLSIRKTSLQLL